MLLSLEKKPKKTQVSCEVTDVGEETCEMMVAGADGTMAAGADGMMAAGADGTMAAGLGEIDWACDAGSGAAMSA